MDPTTTPQPQAPNEKGARRYIVWELPLPYVITLIGSIVGLILTMWFNGIQNQKDVQSLKTEIQELKAEVKSGNSTVTAVASAQALMQFRLETAEADIRILKGQEPRSKRGTNGFP